MKHIILIIFLSVFSTNLIFSQSFFSEDSLNNRNCYWVGFGLGGNHFGPSFSVILSYNNNHDLYSLKFSRSSELNFGVENKFDNPSLQLSEYSFLYGKTLRQSVVLLSFSAGLSYLDGVSRGKQVQDKEFEKIKINTIGIPFETELMLEFSKYAGIGLTFNGNLNKEKSYVGGMFRIKVGLF
jgi:hypothetical protein